MILKKKNAAAAAAALLALGIQLANGQEQEMSFFVTSAGVGDGGNLGGLAGADAHCQRLATAAGAGNKTWHAYLSQAADFYSGAREVHARDRIGNGPWFNAEGTIIADSVENLHGDIRRDSNNIRTTTALDENGNHVNATGDDPNHHDMLTGSDTRGYAIHGNWARELTCDNWTSNDEGRTMVGHHDRTGGTNTSWNSAHLTAGCSQEALVSTGGAALFYCFAID